MEQVFSESLIGSPDMSQVSLSTAGVDIQTFGSYGQNTIPLFRDGVGQTYVLLPTDKGLFAAPYVIGSEMKSATDLPSGGFFDRNKLQKPLPQNPTFPRELLDPQRLLKYPTTVPRPIVNPPAKPPNKNAFDKILDKIKSSLKNELLSRATNIGTDLIIDLLRQKSPGLFGTSVEDVKIDADIFDFSKLSDKIKDKIEKFFSLDNISGQLAKLGIDQLGGLIFSNLWKVDDKSSAAEQLAHKYLEEAFGGIKGLLGEAVKQQILGLFGLGDASKTFDKLFDDFWSDLKKDLKKKFSGETSTAQTNLAHIIADNTADGVVMEGAITVYVNDYPVSRLSDKESLVKPSDTGVINQGNPLVLVETKPASGKGHTGIGLSTGAVTILTNCSPNVFIGQNVVTLQVDIKKPDLPSLPNKQTSEKDAKSKQDDKRKTNQNGKKQDQEKGAKKDKSNDPDSTDGLDEQNKKKQEKLDKESKELEKKKVDESKEKYDQAKKNREDLEKEQLELEKDTKSKARNAQSTEEHLEAIKSAKEVENNISKVNNAKTIEENARKEFEKIIESVRNSEVDPNRIDWGKFGRQIELAGRGLDFVVASSDIYEAYRNNDAAAISDAASRAIGSVAGSEIGASIGVGIGGAVGAVFPPIEPITIGVGGFVGGWVGGVVGGHIGGAINNIPSSPPQYPSEQPRPIPAPAPNENRQTLIRPNQ